MTILQANLKHFYQRRLFWLCYPTLLCVIPLAARPFFDDQSERFFVYLIISYFAGKLISIQQQGVLARPFSFCLPGHRKVSTRITMLVGGILNATLGMVFLAYPGLTFPYSILVVIAGGFVGMTVYLLSIRDMARGSQLNIWMVMTPLYVIGAFLLGIDKTLQEAMVRNPLVFMAIGLTTCWLIWRWIDQDLLARELCGETQKKLRRQIHRQMGNNATGLQSRLEEFFISKMLRHKFLSQDRYAWGRIYADLGPFYFYSKPWFLVAIIVVIIIICGYFNTNYNIMKYFIFLMIPAMNIANMKLPSCPSLLLPGGRREIFKGVLTSGFSIAIINSVVLIILIIMSHLIEPLLPPLHIKTSTFSYQALDIGMFNIFFFFMPIVLTITVTSKQWPILQSVVPMALLPVLIFGDAFNKNAGITISSAIIVLAVIACWLIFVMVAHHFCMKRCLVSQTKG